jgi:amicyanin
MLILACLFAGCASSQTSSAPAAATPTPTPAGNTIAIQSFTFTPAKLTVKSGTTVTWINNDNTPHTVVSDSGVPVSFTSPSLTTGASYPFTFTLPGTYAYHCSIHPSMKGTIVVQS